jgi:fructokinase
LIVVCGEALIDLIPVEDGSERSTPGGGPFNTARALARLEIPTQFLGRLSKDTYGQMLAELLVADGADLSLTSFGPEPSTLAIASVDAGGLAVYRFVSEGTSAPNLTSAMLPETMAPDVKALHVGTLGLVLEPMATTLLEMVEREGGPRLVMLDPNIRPGLLTDAAGFRRRLDRVIAHTTVVKASNADLTWLYPGLAYEAAAGRFLDAGVDLVLVTLGARGAVAISHDVRIDVEAPAVEVVDTIGAGDAFGAAFLAWLEEHDSLTSRLRLGAEDLRTALEFSCLVASLTCTRPGAEPPWRSEVQVSLNPT